MKFPLVHVLNAGLLAVLFGWSWRVFPDLPAEIPGHLGPGGVRRDPTTLGSWFLLPLVALGTTLMNYALGPVIRRTRKVNLPSGVRFDDLLPEDQDVGLTVRILQWMNVILVVGFGLLQAGSHQIAMDGVDGPAPPTIVALVLLLACASVPTWFAKLLTRALVPDGAGAATVGHG